jgi:hypothetical protein
VTLWILFCRMSRDIDTLFTFYARDREHAEEKAAKILEEHPYERLDLKAYPRGFRMVVAHIPGTIEEDV